MAWEGSKFLGGVETIRQKINCYFEEREKETRTLDRSFIHAELGGIRSSDKADFYVLLPYRPPQENWAKCEAILRNLIVSAEGDHPVVRVLLCSPLSYAERPKAPIVYMMQHGKDFSQGDDLPWDGNPLHIPAGSRIIVIGDALHAVARTTDLETERFYDTEFNQPCFWSPVYRSWIYPVSHLYEIVEDRFEAIHFGSQLNMVLRGLPAVAPRRFAAKLETDASLETIKALAKSATAVAIDTETDGLHFIKNRIWCVTLSFDGRTAYFLDTRKWLKGGPEWKELCEALKPLKQVWANGKFDIKFFRQMGAMDFRVDWDVVQAGHVLNELATHNGLKAQSWLYSTFGGYEEKFDIAFNTLCKKSISNVPWPILQEYAAMDALVTFQVYRGQDNHISQIDRDFPNTEFEPNGWTLRKYYEEVMIPTVNMFIDIEEQGMLINRSAIDEARENLSKLQDELLAQVMTELCRGGLPEINVDSGPQLGQRLEALGWPEIMRSKAGYFLTNEFCLKKWSKNHPAAELILQYRSVNTLLKTYVGVPSKEIIAEVEYDLATGEELLPEMSDPTGFYQHLTWHTGDQTYRVHPTFWTMLANTGRNRCSEPNLQNIPKRGKSAAIIRKFFDVPGDDWMVGEWDASGLQLRIMGVMSEDPAMYEAFVDPEIQGDLHSVTGNTVFCPDVSLKEFREKVALKEQPYKGWRDKAKSANFSLIFNTAAFAFARDTLEVEWTLQESMDYVRDNDLERSRLYFLSLLTREDGMGQDFPTMQAKEEFSYYWCSAADIKDKFFKKYPMVAELIERYANFAKEHGYVRSVFGAIRRTPYLRHEGKNTPRTEFKKYLNITVNSPVQTYEAVVMMLAMVATHRRLREEGLKSYLVGNIHDSCVMYVHKSEVQRVYEISREEFSRPRPESKGVPMTMEMDVADVRAGIYWGHKNAVALH